MTSFQQQVVDIISEVYAKQHELKGATKMLVWNLVEAKAKGYISFSLDDISTMKHEVRLLLEVYNHKFKKDVDILRRLVKAVHQWHLDHERIECIINPNKVRRKDRINSIKGYLRKSKKCKQ